MSPTTAAGKTFGKNLEKAIYKENFMTKEQKIEAYARRLAGESYQSIADSFGVTRQYIYLILHNYNETNKLNEICIYKGLGSFLEKKKMTLKEFTELLGCNYSNGVTLKKKLKGLSSFTMDDIRKLLKITGMTFEECFELKN